MFLKTDPFPVLHLWLDVDVHFIHQYFLKRERVLNVVGETVLDAMNEKNKFTMNEKSS